MYFSDDDMYEGLKLSLDTLVDIVKNEKDLKNKRKAASDLAQIILQTIKIKSDKEDWNSLMKDETGKDKEKNEDE
jgi:hypothetical protein